MCVLCHARHRVRALLEPVATRLPESPDATVTFVLRRKGVDCNSPNGKFYV